MTSRKKYRLALIEPSEIVRTGVKALLAAEGDFSALPEMTLAADDSLTIGRKVYVAGYPYGMPFTITEGSVSARNGKGGTSPLRVREQIVSAKTTIEQLRAFANSVSDGSAYKSPESLLK